MPHVTIRPLEWKEDPPGYHTTQTIFGPMWIHDHNGFFTYGYCFTEYHDEADSIPAESIEVAKLALKQKYLQKLQPALEIVHETQGKEVSGGTEGLIEETGRFRESNSRENQAMCVNREMELPVGDGNGQNVAQGDRDSILKALRRILKLDPGAKKFTTIQKMIDEHKYTEAELAD